MKNLNFLIFKDALLVCLILIAGGIFGLHYLGAKSLAQKGQDNSNLASVYQPEQNNYPRLKTFPDLSLEAKSFIVYDAKNNSVIAGKNYDKSLPLASVTKLMTALAAGEVLHPSDKVIIKDAEMTNSADAGLQAGESWYFRDLLKYTMISSSNKGASSLAYGASFGQEIGFVSRMNLWAEKLELPSLIFYNETGLDQVSGRPGAVGSALDVAKLMDYLVSQKPELVSATAVRSLNLQSIDGRLVRALNTNQFVSSWPGRILASKTGFTNLAGGNLVVAVDLGLDRPIIAVVLGSSFDGRFSDMQKVLGATLAYLADN